MSISYKAVQGKVDAFKVVSLKLTIGYIERLGSKWKYWPKATDKQVEYSFNSLIDLKAFLEGPSEIMMDPK